MSLRRKQSGAFYPAGKSRRVFDGSLAAGTRPSWLSEEQAGSAKGAVTITASNDRVTFGSAHGLTQSCWVRFTGVTGAPEIAPGAVYYVHTVVSSTVVTLCAVPEGAQIDVSADGTASGSEGGAGLITYAAGSTVSPGKAELANASATLAGWYGPEIDLNDERIKAVWWTVKDLSIQRSSSGAHISIDFGIRSFGSATAGARLTTGATPPLWPTLECLSGGAAVGAAQVRMPLGSRQGEASVSNPLRLGDSPRPMTFFIDNRDKTVALLMADQVIYHRHRSDLVRGIVRPRLAMSRAGTGQGNITLRKLTVDAAFELVVEYD